MRECRLIHIFPSWYNWKERCLPYEHISFDSASQSTVSKLINTPFGTSIIDEDRGIEVTLSTDEREASLKQREQEMDNRERDIAEQERNLKQRDLLLADLQSPEKIDIAHCGAAPSGGLKELEQRLLKLAAMKSSADYPSPMTTKNFLTQMISSKSVNDGIENFEVPEAELAHYDKSIQNREADARAREIALAGFQLTMEKRVMALDRRENSAAILEAKLQNREKFVQAREQEIKSLNRSLSWRDGLRKKRETELARIFLQNSSICWNNIILLESRNFISVHTSKLAYAKNSRELCAVLTFTSNLFFIALLENFRFDIRATMLHWLFDNFFCNILASKSFFEMINDIWLSALSGSGVFGDLL